MMMMMVVMWEWIDSCTERFHLLYLTFELQPKHFRLNERLATGL
jgi:hypothetical protein